MPGLHFYRSNRLETLVERLGVLLREPLSSALQPEIILVQSLGMRRWLSLQLAELLGVTMNCQFPFPATFAHDLFRAVFREVPETSAFSRENLPWRVMSVLPSLVDAEDAAALRGYL
ncbi:MAG: exodeoxyribonuclease V subunit gamma, partial [Verrucomicrobiaceae bacterium]